MKVLLTANYIVHLILYYAFGRHLPREASLGGALWRSIRYWICRPLFAYCGQNVNVEHGAYFGGGRTISVGSNSGIGIDCRVFSGTRIGANVMMGPEVLIFTTNHSTLRTDIPMIHQGGGPLRPVTIEDDVWIGARVIILPGVTVRSGAVLGAGAVVSRDVPANAVVVGNPGRVVRYRGSLSRVPQDMHRGTPPGAA